MVETKFIIKTNAKQVANNIAHRIDIMKSNGKDVTREVAKYGKNYAQSIAPADTGDTIRAITWSKGKTPASATVVFGNGHPEIKNRIGNFTKYMNDTKRGSPQFNHFRTGKPHFIEITSDRVRGRFSKGMRRVVNAFVNGK